ncbi:MAG: GNAT family N-acetyltransferase [Francisellaceae bacterium]
MKIIALTKTHLKTTRQIMVQAGFFDADVFFSDTQFFSGCFFSGNLIGVVGTEIIGDQAILRTLIVDSKFRNHAIAQALLKHLEYQLHRQGIKNIYCLTQKGANYLSCFGYEQTLKQRLPQLIRTHEYVTRLDMSNRVCLYKRIDVCKTNCHHFSFSPQAA